MCKYNIAAYDRRISPHHESKPDGFFGPNLSESSLASPYLGRQAQHGEGFYWAFSLDMVDL